jgi:hypothetical protein
MARYLALTVALALLPAAAQKPPPAGRGETETVELTATLFHNREALRELLGTDLDGHYIVVRAQVRSRFGREIEVLRDDFVLRTDKDGERSTPFAASQVAGRGALVISHSSRGDGGGIMGESGGPIWGGAPGSTDRPQRIGGNQGTIGGGLGGGESKGTFERGTKDDVPPLEKLLDEKILPEGKTEKSFSGLLYFPLGKQKVKDLELIYTAHDGKISLRFR